MSEEYYEDMLEEVAINKYLNMIANDYNGELAKIFEEKYINKDKEIERLNKALLDIKELVVNNACLSEEDNRCVDDLIYYKCDELLGIVNKALGSDKE